MKNRLVIVSTLLIVFASFFSCGRVFYYNNNESEDCFSVNDADEIYIRKLYSKENDFSGNELTKETSDNANENTLTLVEIQYLIIKGDQVLYLSTTPSRYIYNKEASYLIDKKYPNTFFFSNFYFGKEVKDRLADKKLVFENKKQKQVWELKFNGADKLELISVDEITKKKGADKSSLTIKVNDSFNNPFVFEKINYPFHMGFKSPFTDWDNPKKRVMTFTNVSSDKICFKRNSKNNGQIEQALIRFEDTLFKNQYKTIEFRKKRIPFYFRQ